MTCSLPSCKQPGVRELYGVAGKENGPFWFCAAHADEFEAKGYGRTVREAGQRRLGLEGAAI